MPVAVQRFKARALVPLIASQHQRCLQAEEQDPDLFFRDQPRPAAPEGNVNREYISLFSDEVPLLGGRTPLGCYADYMVSSQ
jgi:hypothetical protein